MRDAAAYLGLMRGCIEIVQERTSGGRTEFESNLVVQDSIVRRLDVLADAAMRLSTSLRERYPEIEWARIRGFRNRIAHGYLDLDLDLTWAVIEHDLPTLSALLDSESRGIPGSSERQS